MKFQDFYFSDKTIKSDYDELRLISLFNSVKKIQVFRFEMQKFSNNFKEISFFRFDSIQWLFLWNCK